MKTPLVLGLVALGIVGQITAQIAYEDQRAAQYPPAPLPKGFNESRYLPPLVPDPQTFTTWMSLGIYGKRDVWQCVDDSTPSSGGGCWAVQRPVEGDDCRYWTHEFVLVWVPYGTYWCPPSNISFTYWISTREGGYTGAVQVASWVAVPYGVCNGAYYATGSRLIYSPDCPGEPQPRPPPPPRPTLTPR